MCSCLFAIFAYRLKLQNFVIKNKQRVESVHEWRRNFLELYMIYYLIYVFTYSAVHAVSKGIDIVDLSQ